MKPKLDFDIKVGYADVSDPRQFDRVSSGLDPQRMGGLNTFGVLSFEWPFRNNAARGQVLQREAALVQNQLKTREVARQIATNVRTVGGELDRVVGELKSLREASNSFREAVQNEREKLGIGTSTIIDVMVTGDRLVTARLNEITVQARYAIALVRYRFETGQLISGNPKDKQASFVGLDTLTTVP
ncbi:MAG: TolC family protein [Pedosphaera sp.]|nr:TolC family protein [Pedosphaera sp.]